MKQIYIHNVQFVLTFVGAAGLLGDIISDKIIVTPPRTNPVTIVITKIQDCIESSEDALPK